MNVKTVDTEWQLYTLLLYIMLLSIYHIKHFPLSFIVFTICNMYNYTILYNVYVSYFTKPLLSYGTCITDNNALEMIRQINFMLL